MGSLLWWVKLVEVVDESGREGPWWSAVDLLDFGGMRICMADFGWRASFGESTEKRWARRYGETGTGDWGRPPFYAEMASAEPAAGLRGAFHHAKSKMQSQQGISPVLHAWPFHQIHALQSDLFLLR